MTQKDKAAVALGKKRWAGVDPEARKAAMSAAAASISKKAASARAKKAWKTKKARAASQDTTTT